MIKISLLSMRIGVAGSAARVTPPGVLTASQLMRGRLVVAVALVLAIAVVHWFG